jgi:PilZ domain
MSFTIRPYRRFPVPCAVSYNAGPFQGQGTLWNLSCTGWRFSGDLPLRPGVTLSLTVTLPNEQRIVLPEAVVRWSQGQEFGIETDETSKHTPAR